MLANIKSNTEVIQVYPLNEETERQYRNSIIIDTSMLRSLELKIAKLEGNQSGIRVAQENLIIALKEEILGNEKEIVFYDNKLENGNIGLIEKIKIKMQINKDLELIKKLNERISAITNSTIPTFEEATEELEKINAQINQYTLELDNDIYKGLEREKLVGQINTLKYRRDGLQKITDTYRESFNLEQKRSDAGDGLTQ